MVLAAAEVGGFSDTMARTDSEGNADSGSDAVVGSVTGALDTGEVCACVTCTAAICAKVLFIRICKEKVVSRQSTVKEKMTVSNNVRFLDSFITVTSFYNRI